MKIKSFVLKIILISIAIIAIRTNISLATDEVASGDCGPKVKWSLNSKGVLTISGSGAMYGKHFTGEYKDDSPWVNYQDQVKEVVFEGEITSIGDSVFEYNKNITKVTLPSKISQIGIRAFAECSNLKEIVIPDGITRIWEIAFYKCTSLKNVTLKGNVIYLYEYSFAECPSLENITLNTQNIWIDDKENVISPNTMITGYRYSGAHYYARYYGRKFKNIKTGEISQTQITAQSYLNCMPTKNVKPIGVSSVIGYSLDEYGDRNYETAFCFEKQIDNSTYKAIKAKVNELIKDCNTDEEKAKAITRWVYLNIDYQGYYGASADINRIYKIFTELKGSCEVYTMLENYMLYLCGIPTGTATNLTHEWTVAFINGKWVPIDATGGIYNRAINPYTICYAYEGKIYVIDDPYIGAKPANSIKEVPFTDVQITDWHYSAVKYMYQNRYVSGTTATTFSPDMKLTRGMLVTILHNMNGKPNVATKNNFPDVQDSTIYYYKAVNWAVQNKIVSGYENGKFGPDDLITREQLAVILWKYSKYKGTYKEQTADYSKFSDSKNISDFAKKGMNWAVGAGVITGSNGKLLPTGTATRAEAVSMIYKYCTKIK